MILRFTDEKTDCRGCSDLHRDRPRVSDRRWIRKTELAINSPRSLFLTFGASASISFFTLQHGGSAMATCRPACLQSADLHGFKRRSSCVS